ncbi:MAG: hypothetical protein GY788_20985 [bacterium]|nr:hypothetical protein [bacterium]
MNVAPALDLPGCYDPASQPDPETCECGETYPHVWWRSAPRYARHGVRDVWRRPVIDPCVRCEASQGVQEGERAHRHRIAASGVQPEHRRYRLDTLVSQHDDEDEHAFIRRIKLRPRTIGVLTHWHDPKHLGAQTSNLDAVAAVKDWDPKPGGGWLWVQGKKGRGKTLLMAALVAKLTKDLGLRLDGEDLGPCRPGSRTFRGRRGQEVRIVNALELRKRADEWKSSKDKDPWGVESERDVLIIDDLGREAHGLVKGWATGAHGRMAGLIHHRHLHGLPTAFTTNLVWADVMATGEPYGDDGFVASRLSELVRDTVTMGGPDWRGREGG